MILTLYVSNGCPTCRKVEYKLKSFIRNNERITLKVADLEETGTDFPIVPALFVDDLLFSYGDFDVTKLYNVINRKLKQ